VFRSRNLIRLSHARPCSLHSDGQYKSCVPRSKARSPTPVHASYGKTKHADGQERRFKMLSLIPTYACLSTHRASAASGNQHIIVGLTFARDGITS
jgi:hypothetical protein